MNQNVFWIASEAFLKSFRQIWRFLNANSECLGRFRRAFLSKFRTLTVWCAFGAFLSQNWTTGAPSARFHAFKKTPDSIWRLLVTPEVFKIFRIPHRLSMLPSISLLLIFAFSRIDSVWLISLRLLFSCTLSPRGPPLSTRRRNRDRDDDCTQNSEGSSGKVDRF